MDTANSQSSKNSDNANITLLARHSSYSATAALSAPEATASDTHSDATFGQAVLLATAQLRACDINGKQHVLRVLFDSGSHSSFITEACVQRLQLAKRRSEVIVSGIGCSKGKVKGETSLLLTPMEGTETFPLSALVLTKLTESLPATKIHSSKWPHIEGLKLADPQYYLPARIDLIIGSDEMYSLLETEVIKGPPNTPIAQKTVFGWVLFGKLTTLDKSNNTSPCIYSDRDLTKAVIKAWTLDELPETRYFTTEETRCENLFETTHRRNTQGRFIVHLPFRENIKLGDSRAIAIQCWLRMERRLELNNEHREQYHAFLQDMLDQGHMEPYALTADISGMYRQVMVAEEHVDYQRVIWRRSKHEPLQDFRILRVTYGIASSSHLAIKALQQTAKEAATCYPLASSVILRDFYMDDLLTGSSSETSLNSLRKEISRILGNGCFELRKWATNSPFVIRNIPLDAREHNISHLLADDDTVRALGLMWNSTDDYLYFDIKLGSPPKNLTKRSLLSDSCRLFDPTGKLAPITLVPKTLFQRLWQLGLDWDDAVPEDIAACWLNHRENLKLLSGLKIQRWLGTGMEGSKTDLHCFADASEQAYAGVVYARTRHADGSITVAMVSAKTKVSPLRSISIAKLELCAAVLVSKLAHHVQQSLAGLVSKIYGWTDSMNALAWLQSHPSRWSVFVANRVATAQSNIASEDWSHVCTTDNPADCASRGMQPAQFIQHKLWWNGPPWLSQDDKYWPNSPSIPPTELELRPKRTLTHTASIGAASFIARDMLARFSSFLRLKRITAYWLRYIRNLREKQRQGGPLTYAELRAAEEYWIRQVQREAFNEEIWCCQHSKPISLRSSLIRLNVFLDDNNILRAGGTIRRSAVSPDIKFPIVLPSRSSIVIMIINDLHKSLLHGGPQLMQTVLQRRFWVMGARGLVRKIFHNCTTCRRQGAIPQQQMMADLPSFRVNYAGRPFSVTGVDMAGPFSVKFSKGRGSKSTKGYIAVFICMATGAMHLELASNLSSETFISVIKRFASRRGYCRTYVSDNGTNFVGAEKDLRTVFQQAMNDPNLQHFFANSSIDWQFNPPSGPHMGGFWESAVKRVKFHLRRALKSTLLTYEEFYTLITEVEACVNSRPLCPLSSSSSDLETLTPGHFLIGEPLKALPEPTMLDFKGNINQRWQLISAVRNHFWRRWQLEYLSTLQTRAKWVRPKKNIREGDLVVVRDERIPPANWKLARVVKCHPGQDGYTRVVDIKTAEGLLTRPIVKLVPILSDDEKSQ
ncbi:PREDICTED: uncharacterized protein LOC108372938 [Rhagoletis zephyria]|uniref:uncharacterized protein LOC108372938 n=1 Tax=Rhagoletis zephyria TaxID=28612 RepID=UPI0008117DCF|nr:PREDICTED: uncharacterized protein LOC108372938 [Rhagoletis zephyria]